ncbi:MAG: FimV/HubP family polar landmark protein [Luteimonas sp.]
MAIVAAPAAALGLGQIEVKSQRDQPLLAEIPIISSDPAELQGLQVRLAPPETFRRVGLEPPQGVVSALRFEPALDARGRPVIRVTSAAPVQQPLLTFLLEVDWGEGRLVREYSALLDTPRTVSAPLQPPIQAPTVAPPNTILRPVEAPVAAAPLPEPTPVAAAPVTTPPPAQESNAIPLPPPVAPAPAPAPAPVAAAPATAPVATPAPTPVPSSEYGPVQRGQTLSQIAATLDGAEGYSLAQTMLALLRANPDAFIGDNINLLKQGAVLRLPPADEIAHYSATEAAAVVREQIAQWREARRPPAQPAAVATTSGTPSALRSSDRAAANAARTADARLEIVPPSSGRGQRAGGPNQAMRSGIQVGGEGEMLRQQLQETKETLAARTAEVSELKTRVVELEKLQQQQQQLITMKDSELAAAQQTLAASNRQAAMPAQAATTAQTQQPTAPPQPQERGNSWIWLWGGIVLVLAALIGWLLTRRRQRVVAPAPRGFDTAALAASIAPATREVEPDEASGGTDDMVADAVEIEDEELTPMPTQPPHWTSAPAAIGGIPPWHGGVESVEPAAHAAEVGDASQQLELARAYLDLGDDDAARTLLREVLDGRDPAARETAARMLRDL